MSFNITTIPPLTSSTEPQTGHIQRDTLVQLRPSTAAASAPSVVARSGEENDEMENIMALMQRQLGMLCISRSPTGPSDQYMPGDFFEHPMLRVLRSNKSRTDSRVSNIIWEYLDPEQIWKQVNRLVHIGSMEVEEQSYVIETFGQREIGDLSHCDLSHRKTLPSRDSLYASRSLALFSSAHTLRLADTQLSFDYLHFLHRCDLRFSCPDTCREAVMPNVRTLDLTGNPNIYTAILPRRYGYYMMGPELREYNDLSFRRLALLLKRVFPNLQNLCLNRCDLRDEYICEIVKTFKLTELHVADNPRITDTAALALVQSSTLRVVNVRATAITAVGRATLFLTGKNLVS